MLLLMSTGVFLELIMDRVQELIHFKKLRPEYSLQLFNSIAYNLRHLTSLVLILLRLKVRLVE